MEVVGNIGRGWKKCGEDGQIRFGVELLDMFAQIFVMFVNVFDRCRRVFERFVIVQQCL